MIGGTARTGLSNCHTLCAWIVAAAVLAAVAGPTASASSMNGVQVVYSETYLRYVASFPQGWAPNYCELAVALNGGSGVCEAIIDPVYFYPDGTLGSRPWDFDPASPTGWSIPNPCAELPDVDWETWTAYVDGTNYPGAMPVPRLSEAQVECGIWRYGWWF